MLTGLRLQNFKAWQDSGDIRLAPLTVRRTRTALVRPASRSAATSETDR